MGGGEESEREEGAAALAESLFWETNANNVDVKVGEGRGGEGRGGVSLLKIQIQCKKALFLSIVLPSLTFPGTGTPLNSPKKIVIIHNQIGAPFLFKKVGITLKGCGGWGTREKLCCFF